MPAPLSLLDLRIHTDEWLQTRRWPSPENHIATADGLLTAWLVAEGRWRLEHDAALGILAPVMPSSGLVDACRQVRQALVLERAAAEMLERRLEALRETLDRRNLSRGAR